MPFVPESRLDQLNREALKIFRQHGKTETELAPMLYTKLVEEPQLLYMGINPSFNEKQMARYDPEIYPLTATEVKEHHLLGNAERYYEEIKQFQRLGKEKYAIYFNAFANLSKGRFGLDSPNVGSSNSWDHIDLFWSREKSQSNLDLVRRIRGELTLSSFGRDQLDLTRRLLCLIKPRNILIANKLASDVFLANFDLTIRYDPAVNFAEVTFEGQPCRVFFSSTLAGQRALDTYTRNLLVAHIQSNMLKV